MKVLGNWLENYSPEIASYTAGNLVVEFIRNFTFTATRQLSK
jgi:hypothetical protein